MKINIVVTTIYEPRFIANYHDNFNEFKVEDDIHFIIIGDYKTPSINKFDFGPDVEYWNVESQCKWLFDHGIKLDPKIIPNNSPRRRNIGYLFSLEREPDITIVIDDDNLPFIDDFVGCHKYPFTRGTDRFPLVASDNKVVNHCFALIMNHKNIYGRGFPLDKMYKDTWNAWGPKPYDSYNKNVVMHMGLWNNKPDVDAITNIAYPDLNSKGRYQYNPYYELDNNNYISINTQNTSFNKDVAKIFWNVHQPAGCNRFDDIWNGLFIQKIAHRRGEAITFGAPLTNHARNVHDYSKDLQQEYTGMLINSALWDFVMNLRIESKDYTDAYLEIAEALYTRHVTNNYIIEKYMEELAESMKEWVNIVDKVI